MGRKPSSSKNIDTVSLSTENAHPASGGNIKSTWEVDAKLENTQQGKMYQDIKNQKKSNPFTKKKSKCQSSSVRRSDRIKSGVLNTPNSNQGNGYIEDITISESDTDEPGIQLEQTLQVLEEPEPQPPLKLEPTAENLSGKSLDEKVDQVLLRMEAKILEFVNSKVDGNVGVSESPLSYRSIYIDSQKKLEAMTNENRQLTEKLENALRKIERLEALKDENRQLAGKLEHALGKIEVYEKQSGVSTSSEPWDKFKDTANAAVSVLSNLTKTAEALVNASNPANHNAASASAKRKRNES